MRTEQKSPPAIEKGPLFGVHLRNGSAGLERFEPSPGSWGQLAEK